MRRRPNNPTGEDVNVRGFVDLELIDRGGFSRVFKATQEGLGRVVALKVLDTEFGSADKQKSFERECRAMGALSQHPNIVTVFSAAFSSRGLPIIVMEYYESGSLSDRVKALGPLGLDSVVEVGLLVCDALDAAHRSGIVHRDIKPQNLFSSQYATVVLGDFGISSFEDDRTMTQSGAGLTVHYAPPELLEGAPATAQSDVYSLAATLYYLASGERPFPRGEDESISDVARRILVAPPPVFDRDGSGRELGLLLARGMAKSPIDRPDSAREFHDLLSEITNATRSATRATSPLPASPPEETRIPGAGPPPPRPESLDSVGLPREINSPPKNDLTPEDEPGPDNDSEAVTVGRPEPVPDSPGPNPSRRNLLFGGIAAAAVLLVVGLSILLRQSEQSPPPTTASVSELDDFFGAPRPPSGVTIDAEGDSYLVRWDRVEEASRYEVVRLDVANQATIVSDLELVIPGGSPERPCVVVRSIGETGRLSSDSPSVCAPP